MVETAEARSVKISRLSLLHSWCLLFLVFPPSPAKTKTGEHHHSRGKETGFLPPAPTLKTQGCLDDSDRGHWT